MKINVYLFLVFFLAACGNQATNSTSSSKTGVASFAIQGSLSVAGRNSADYIKLARITKQKATQIAQQKISGTVTQVSLENENNFLVYAVVARSKGQLIEILVDAGNGKVLIVQNGATGQVDAGDNSGSNDGESKD